MKNTKLLQLKRRYQTSLRKNSRTDELATSLTSVKHVIDRHTNDENVRVTYVKERKICILLATLLIGRVKWDLYPHMASVMSSILGIGQIISSAAVYSKETETGNIIFPLLQWEVSGETNVVQGTT